MKASTAVALVLTSACAAGSPEEAGTIPIGPGDWGSRAELIEPNSELALAELNGKLYLLGGYPASRQTARTVQVYDIATDRWELGPPLPQPNNHGMAVSLNGKVYLIGGQTSDVSDQGYVNTVYELNPATGVWATKAPMPTARGAGVAVVLNGKIYVAGGRPPRSRVWCCWPAASVHVARAVPCARNHASRTRGGTTADRSASRSGCPRRCSVPS